MLSAEVHRENRDAIPERSYGRFLDNRHRYYSPELGRYVSADPIGQKGGPNVFLYGRANPLRFFDPLGLEPPEAQHPAADICAAIEEAKRLGIWDFIKNVQTGGEWDYKNVEDPETGQVDPSKYEDFGSYHFGVVARARGWSSGTTQRGAGAYQIYSGTSRHHWGGDPYQSSSQGNDWDWPWGDAPYGDDPEDNEWIREGTTDFDAGYWEKRCNQCPTE
jgi:RHS repeat-associated protein